MQQCSLLKKGLTIGIILLFIGTTTIPSNGQKIEKPSPTSRGNWLYVGGSGPGNYTRIQDAINASTDGDTVFVYDDDAPYHEQLTINKTISLIGESMLTTVIDGNKTLAVIIIVFANGVQIRNLTIRNATSADVVVCGDDVTIMQTSISGANMGIDIKVFWLPYVQRERISLLENHISHTYFGIMTSYYCNNSTFQGNTIEDNQYGVVLYSSFHNTILLNTIRNNSKEGILDAYGADNSIMQNTFEDNLQGLEINCSYADHVERNTFLGNAKHANFAKLPYWECDHLFEARHFKVSYILANYHAFGSTTWDANYWNASLTHPYLIRGWSLYQSRFPHLRVPRFEVDRHPAQKPYDIPGVR